MRDVVDALRVDFVEVFSDMFFLVLRVKCIGYVFPCEFERDLLYWKICIGDIYEELIFSLVKTWCERWVTMSMLDREVWEVL